MRRERSWSNRAFERAVVVAGRFRATECRTLRLALENSMKTERASCRGAGLKFA